MDLTEILDLPVVENTELDGMASLADSIDCEDEAEAGRQFQNVLEEHGLRASGARGVRIDQALRLFKWFRSRRLVEDLGCHEVDLDWLGFHVPQGGTGRLVLGHSNTEESLLKLTFLGFGGGSRLRYSVSAKRDFGLRSTCFYLGTRVSVRLRTFAENGAAEANVMQVDIGEPVNDYLRPAPDCPLCFRSAGCKPAKAKPSGQSWDLRADGQGISETLTYELSKTWQFEASLKIPVLKTDLKPAIEMTRSIASSCSVAYEFPGGRRFTGYELIGSRLNLPFWGTD